MGITLGTTPRALTSLGEEHLTTVVPRAQIEATYGVRESAEVFTDAAPGTGSVSAADGTYVLQTGTGLGGFAVLRTRRTARYRPGQSLQCYITAAFDSGNATAFSLQAAGPFNTTTGFFVGYDGASFGVMHRTDGAIEIRIATITASASGSEDLTITLSGTAYGPVPVTSGTEAENAQAIEAWFAANVAAWRATANGDTVTFFFRGAGAQSGAYSIASTGSLTATFATYQAGAATVETWTPQASWSGDTCDGSGDSGFSLDASKLNYYLFEIGADIGTTSVYVMSPSGPRWIHMHDFEFANSRTTTAVRNATMTTGWVSASLGSTTNLTVRGTSAMIGSDGDVAPFDRSRGASARNANVGTALEAVVSIRNRLAFGDTHNLRLIYPLIVDVANEGTREIEVVVVLNETFDTSTDLPTWSYVDQDESITEVDTSGRAVNGVGNQVASFLVPRLSSGRLNINSLTLSNRPDLQLQPYETITVLARVTGGSAAAVNASITWIED